uniref:Uncharacterized protein n=1 Tax=Arundo donax TaxID=35708 RepID=A0A0A9GC85_ARUDO
MPILEHGNMVQRRAYSHHKLDKVNLPGRSLKASHHKLFQVMQPKLGGLPGYFFTRLVLARGDVDVKGLKGRRYLKQKTRP